jgi:DNA-binding response OmpR family regulator
MLLCEPQVDLATALLEFLSGENYTIELETNGLRALELLREQQIDIAVLEIALHGLDGLSVIRDYRTGGGSAPILLLTSPADVDEFQAALDAGADACLAKPFRLTDLAAQLRAMLRRPTLRSERVLTLGGLTLDTEYGTVIKDDKPIHLFPMEFKLLRFLMKHPNQVFGARAIFARVWQKEQGITDDTVRTHIRTLRRKIDTHGCPSFIITVRGLGYKTEGP